MLQVYAACSEGDMGYLQIKHIDRLVETLSTSPPDFVGMTGMWSIPARPHDVHHHVVVMSFVSGSRAMTAGESQQQVSKVQCVIFCTAVYNDNR
jgi:hypothetical protein